MEPRGSRSTSAAYGRACSNCVTAKCKCIPLEGTSCERCLRLNKDCQPAVFVRKKGPQRGARKLQLEDKLDNLVNLLQAQQAPTPSITPSPTNQPQPQQRLNCLDERAPISRPPKHISSDETNEEILSRFRPRYLDYFPFIDLPSDRKSIEAFVREYPTTYRAIQVICMKDRAKQNAYGTRVREDLILRVVPGGERSLDLLLCLLVCLTWQVYFTPSRRGGVGMFINVAKHMIADLGYNRPTRMVMACPKPPAPPGQLPDQQEARNDEERRALLSCFALGAIAALAVKSEPMRWSSFIARACARLSKNVHNKGDTVLVAIARISRVSVEAYNILQSIQDDPESAPHAVHQIKALRIMLDVVRGGLTPDQLQNCMVLNYFHAVEVQIYEPALYGIPPRSSTVPLDFQRIECFTACLQACKASLDNYIAIPSLTMNMPQVLAFSNTSQVLYSLSVLDCVGWDKFGARASVDVLWYFDQVVIKFEEACCQLAEEYGSEENVFSLAGGHEGLRSLSATWRESLEHATGARLDFEGGLPGVGDAWTMNADMWFTNVWGDVQF